MFGVKFEDLKPTLPNSPLVYGLTPIWLTYVNPATPFDLPNHWRGLPCEGTGESNLTRARAHGFKAAFGTWSLQALSFHSWSSFIQKESFIEQRLSSLHQLGQIQWNSYSSYIISLLSNQQLLTKNIPKSKILFTLMQVSHPRFNLLWRPKQFQHISTLSGNHHHPVHRSITSKELA